MSEDDDSGGWQLTESDPGVFTELLKTLGVPLVFDELYSLDAESLTELQPLHALIFLFKWVSPSGASASGSGPSTGGKYDSSFPGFFAHQVVNNACATLAVLNALGNYSHLHSTLDPSSDLAGLFGFTQDMDPQTAGLAVTSADWLRAAHNALSPPSAISLDGLNLPKTTEDAYHFVVYVPVAGSVYELDGLKPHPINHGPYEEKGEGWAALARNVIEKRISTYPPGALEFNLQALHDDPIPHLQEQIKRAQEAGLEAPELVVRLANETQKRERWAFENALRRHNHLGLIHALLLALAKGGKLDATTQSAKATMRERVSKAKERGESMDED